MPLEDQYYRGLQRGLAVRPEQSAVPQLGGLAGGYGQAQLGNYANTMNRDTQITGLRNQLADERMFQKEARGENRMATAIGVGNFGLTGYQMVEAQRERERQEMEHKKTQAYYKALNKALEDWADKMTKTLQQPVAPLWDNIPYKLPTTTIGGR